MGHNVIFYKYCSIQFRNLMSIQFRSSMLSLNVGFEVKLIRHQANMIIYTIARAAISCSRCHIFDSVLSYINNLLHDEMI
jgi:hypothetical protein